jgi:hypothetical protein
VLWETPFSHVSKSYETPITSTSSSFLVVSTKVLFVLMLHCDSRIFCSLSLFVVVFSSSLFQPTADWCCVVREFLSTSFKDLTTLITSMTSPSHVVHQIFVCSAGLLNDLLLTFHLVLLSIFLSCCFGLLLLACFCISAFELSCWVVVGSDHFNDDIASAWKCCICCIIPNIISLVGVSCTFQVVSTWTDSFIWHTITCFAIWATATICWAKLKMHETTTWWWF